MNKTLLLLITFMMIYLSLNYYILNKRSNRLHQVIDFIEKKDIQSLNKTLNSTITFLGYNVDKYMIMPDYFESDNYKQYLFELGINSNNRDIAQLLVDKKLFNYKPKNFQNYNFSENTIDLTINYGGVSNKTLYYLMIRNRCDSLERYFNYNQTDSQYLLNLLDNMVDGDIYNCLENLLGHIKLNLYNHGSTLLKKIDFSNNFQLQEKIMLLKFLLQNNDTIKYLNTSELINYIQILNKYQC